MPLSKDSTKKVVIQNDKGTKLITQNGTAEVRTKDGRLLYNGPKKEALESFIKYG
jgi:hypothetical protein